MITYGGGRNTSICAQVFTICTPMIYLYTYIQYTYDARLLPHHIGKLRNHARSFYRATNITVGVPNSLATKGYSYH